MQYNHFHLVNEPVVEPPFLVRDVNPASLVHRLNVRMDAEGVDIKEPKKYTAQNGMAAIGLAIEQAEALVDALEGKYANKYWADTRAGLSLIYPIELIDVLYGDKELPAPELRGLVKQAFAIEAGAEVSRALEFLYRSWETRQKVINEGRPMSLIPIIGGELQGDTPSFTPVVSQLDDGKWRMGWDGDTAKVSPTIINATDPAKAIKTAFETYSNWYEKDKGRMIRDLRAKKDQMNFKGEFYVPVWGYMLRKNKVTFGKQGEVELENISHNRLFRLKYVAKDGSTQKVIFDAGHSEAILIAIAAANGEIASYPHAELVKEAYLTLLGTRGNMSGIAKVQGEARDALPLTPETITEWQKVSISIEDTVTVAWVKHPKAIAVVSGSMNKTRAMVMGKNEGKELGVFPVTLKTRKPNTKDLWQGSAMFGLDWQNDPVAKEAVSTWLAWLWQKKAEQKKYQV